jgi:very-short-patch-repair endonuclease
VNKTEGKLYEILLPLYPTLISQFKQDWCKNNKSNRFLPFDFCIPEDKIIIELDGPQHFKQISNWSNPEKQFENDKYKEQCANDNNYSVIRLLQEDIFNDTYDWLKELSETIEETKNGSDIVNTYLCKNNEYDAY